MNTVTNPAERPVQTLRSVQHLTIWQNTYLVNVKPRTAVDYTLNIRKHIMPALGAVKLEALATPTVQQFYNNLVRPVDEGGKGLSPMTLRNIHLVLHRSLRQTVLLGYIRTNPTDACNLPRVEKKEIRPLDGDDTVRFIQAIQGDPFETIYLVTLFTGMRKGEVFGLTWDCIDFAVGTITPYKRNKGSYRTAWSGWVDKYLSRASLNWGMAAVLQRKKSVKSITVAEISASHCCRVRLNQVLAWHN